MTKQEEIREGIAELFYKNWAEQSPNPYTSFGKLAKGVRDIYLKSADEFLSYLHSQGVVIKVKCPDCVWSQFGEGAVGMTPCYRCNSTGYIIEPLIGDE